MGYDMNNAIYYSLYIILYFIILYYIYIIYYIILYYIILLLGSSCYSLLLLFQLNMSSAAVCSLCSFEASRFGAFCRTCVSTQVRYRRAVTRPFVRLSVRQQLTCERNSSYSFCQSF